MFHNFNPYQKHLQEAGLVFEVSQDKSEIAFVKHSPYAVFDQVEGNIYAYWTDSYLMLEGIKFHYRQWYSIDGNSVLKKYLTQLFGYKGETE